MEVSPLDGEKGLRVRVPLENRALRGLFGAESTWQYVFVSAWSPWSRGAIMPASRRPSIDRAGGSASPFTPAVFDLLSDEPGAQEAELSSWDENALALSWILARSSYLFPESLFYCGFQHGARAVDATLDGALGEADGTLHRIVEAKDATPDELANNLCNSGVT